MTGFEWGDTVTRSECGGVPFLMYPQRRRRVPELLDDAARWGTRPHLIQGTRTLTFHDCFAAIDYFEDNGTPFVIAYSVIRGLWISLLRLATPHRVR